MAETGNYPQLPRNVWRGVWDILRKTPKRKLDEKALAAEVGVQPTAAKAYSRELVKLGLLDEDSNPTELAGRWRQDGQDGAVIDEILAKAYPQELLDLAPRGDQDREKIIRWFMNDGLGEGSAKNKTATFLMVSQGVTDELLSVASPRPARTKVPAKDKAAKANDTKDSQPSAGSPRRPQTKPDLNVNVQIHISAEASVEQINAIFLAMKRYFDDDN